METDQLIADIARTTGLRLEKADPILAAAVINEVLLDRALVKLDRQVKIQADRVTAASTQGHKRFWTHRKRLNCSSATRVTGSTGE